MSDLARHDRASLLARMAPHSSVTPSVLLDGDGLDGPSRLSGDPPLDYLDDSEAPAYVLTNEKRGIGIGTKGNRTQPDAEFGTVIVVTGRRTLALVGRSSDDAVVEVPHGAAKAVTPHTGWFAHRLELRTPTGAYHCWVPRGTESGTLEEIAEFVDDHEGEPEAEATLPERVAANRAAASTNGAPEDDAEITYRGQPVDPSYLE